MTMTANQSHYLALCGGVGGAKLAHGLSVRLGKRLSIAVNTGDDFEHLGLHVSPDIDTVVYTLAGLADAARGWGRSEESWAFMDALAGLGGPSWFRLGDRDLAMHVLRTRWLAEGGTLSAFCERIRKRLGIAPAIHPMSDDSVRTMLATDEGELAFQDYFVARQCRPRVAAIRYEGAKTARPNREIIALLGDPSLAGVIIWQSNPFLSIDPILSLPELRGALRACSAPVVAISPIIRGKAIKGPAAKLMEELGAKASARGVAEHYAGLIDGFIFDTAEGTDAAHFPVTARGEQTLMTDLPSRIALAGTAIEFCHELRVSPVQLRRTGG